MLGYITNIKVAIIPVESSGASIWLVHKECLSDVGIEGDAVLVVGHKGD